MFSKILHSWITYATAALTIIATIIARGLPVIKAWLGFKKEVLETKKTGLEVNKLAREEMEEAALVKPASIEDVYRFDPTFRKLRGLEESWRAPLSMHRFPSFIGILFFLFLVLGILVGALWLRSCFKH